MCNIKKSKRALSRRIPGISTGCWEQILEFIPKQKDQGEIPPEYISGFLGKRHKIFSKEGMLLAEPLIKGRRGLILHENKTLRQKLSNERFQVKDIKENLKKLPFGL